MISRFLSFILLKWHIPFIDLHRLNHPCLLGVIPSCSWCMIFLMYCSIRLTKFFWECLHLYSPGILVSSFLPLYYPSVAFVSGSWCPCKMSLGTFFPLQILGRVWEGLIFSSVQFSRSVVSDSLRPHESQHARPPCPSPTLGVHSDLTSIESVMPSSHLSCSLNDW